MGSARPGLGVALGRASAWEGTFARGAALDTEMTTLKGDVTAPRGDALTSLGAVMSVGGVSGGDDLSAEPPPSFLVAAFAAAEAATVAAAVATAFAAALVAAARAVSPSAPVAASLKTGAGAFSSDVLAALGAGGVGAGVSASRWLPHTENPL